MRLVYKDYVSLTSDWNHPWSQAGHPIPFLLHGLRTRSGVNWNGGLAWNGYKPCWALESQQTWGNMEARARTSSQSQPCLMLPLAPQTGTRAGRKPHPSDRVTSCAVIGLCLSGQRDRSGLKPPLKGLRGQQSYEATRKSLLSQPARLLQALLVKQEADLPGTESAASQVAVCTLV